MWYRILMACPMLRLTPCHDDDVSTIRLPRQRMRWDLIET